MNLCWRPEKISRFRIIQLKTAAYRFCTSFIWNDSPSDSSCLNSRRGFSCTVEIPVRELLLYYDQFLGLCWSHVINKMDVVRTRSRLCPWLGSPCQLSQCQMICYALPISEAPKKGYLLQKLMKVQYRQKLYKTVWWERFGLEVEGSQWERSMYPCSADSVKVSRTPEFEIFQAFVGCHIELRNVGLSFKLHFKSQWNQHTKWISLTIPIHIWQFAWNSNHIRLGLWLNRTERNRVFHRSYNVIIISFHFIDSIFTLKSMEHQIMINHTRLRLNLLEAAYRIYYMSLIIRSLVILIDESPRLVSRFESETKLSFFIVASWFTFIFTNSICKQTLWWSLFSYRVCNKVWINQESVVSQ